jgi:acetyl-CoA C-acetyltransferase
MGCTQFGEHWNRSTDDLLIDSTQEAFGSVGLTKDDVDAYWLGTMGSGQGSGLTLCVR